MIRFKTFLIPALALSVTLAIGARAQQTPEPPTPEEVLSLWVAAFNEGDYQRAASFFAEDAVVTFVPAFFQPPIVSRRDLLAAFVELTPSAPRMEVVPRQRIGEDIIVTQTREWDEEAQRMGIEVLEFVEIYVIRDGLIQGATAVMTPHSLELARAAMAAMDAE